MRVSIFTLTFALLSLSAEATEVQSRFLALGTKIPLALKKLGYTHIGDIQLDEFIKGIQEVSVNEASVEEIANSNCDGRITAHYDPVKGILIDGEKVSRFPEEASILALHEYIRASKPYRYYDEQYWISMTMWFLSLKETHELLEKDQLGRIEAWLAKVTRVRYAKGSVVGVGGGGEMGTLWVRTRRLRDYLANLRKAKAQNDEKAKIEALTYIGLALDSQLSVGYYQAAKKCK